MKIQSCRVKFVYHPIVFRNTTTDCGPLVYSYGTTAAHDTKEGVTYSVTCEEGFAPEVAETKCMSNGSWVPQPKCLKGKSLKCM
ncbi:hypothetical protein DPMN_098664 [Dreissena polymorpha]|uniref:Sushi domain-containing protein n=1 Tax=Dreissena polymorpha TaxID=45954 RepID=A0A9D4LE23_DREPO|nr:hypothetical protein DPMN_098664 [Dreissena polymorpha]